MVDVRSRARASLDAPIRVLNQCFGGHHQGMCFCDTIMACILQSVLKFHSRTERITGLSAHHFLAISLPGIWSCNEL